MDRTIRDVRAYARNESEEAELIAFGVPARLIYVEGRNGETLSAINMRYGEFLLTAGGLRPLGDTTEKIMQTVERVHAARAAIVDIRGDRLRSDRHLAKMLSAALSAIRGEKTMPPGRARQLTDARWGKLRKNRRPEQQARIIWLGLAPEYVDLSIPQKLALMGPGYSRSGSWLKFGKIGKPRGRVPKPKTDET